MPVRAALVSSAHDPSLHVSATRIVVLNVASATAGALPLLVVDESRWRSRLSSQFLVLVCALAVAEVSGSVVDVHAASLLMRSASFDLRDWPITLPTFVCLRGEHGDVAVVRRTVAPFAASLRD